VILAGDIGGTKTRLALNERGGSPRAPLREQRFASGEFGSLETMIRAFLDGHGERPTHVALGIAGPVVDQRVETTNLPWQVDGRAMRQALNGAEVLLLNDLESTAWGLAELSEHELEALQPGTPVPGNRALIAAGTGLGEAMLLRESRRWRPIASEGGHADFAARDEVEDGLLHWLRDRYGHVSYERVLSGRGLVDLYRFLRELGLGEEPVAIASEFDAAPDPAVVITRTALDGSCERAALAVDRFLRIYGAEAGNLALKALAVGGVYVGGGIAPRLLPVLRNGGFVRTFADKGRLAPLMAGIPVHVILDDRTALWGAAAVALALT
jgi:glucokinase